MLKTITRRAPGKILWLGGYSVLERPNISYVTAVNAYVTATVTPKTDQSVILNAPQLGLSAKGTVDKLTGVIDMQVPKELLLLKTAAEVASRYSSSKGAAIGGFSITTNNDKQFAYAISDGKVVKSGLGTSAAVTVAAVDSILNLFGENPNENDSLHKLSQISHSIATGKVGSGFDIAAATHGSITYARYSPEIIKGLSLEYGSNELKDLVSKKWDYSIEKLGLPDSLRMSFANFGESMITTKAIGSVSEFKIKDPDTYLDLVNEINHENVAAINALKKVIKSDYDSLEIFRAAFERGRYLTKKLGMLSRVGIEPDDCTDLIEKSMKNGAYVAKLPGAGGKDAIAAFSLDARSQNNLIEFWKSQKNLNAIEIKEAIFGTLKSE